MYELDVVRSAIVNEKTAEILTYASAFEVEKYILNNPHLVMLDSFRLLFLRTLDSRMTTKLVISPCRGYLDIEEEVLFNVYAKNGTVMESAVMFVSEYSDISTLGGVLEGVEKLSRKRFSIYVTKDFLNFSKIPLRLA